MNHWWINVNSELPELDPEETHDCHNDDLIVFDGDRIIKGVKAIWFNDSEYDMSDSIFQFEQDGWTLEFHHSDTDDDTLIDNVTHWMNNPYMPVDLPK